MLIRDTNILKKYAHLSGTWNYSEAESTLRIVELKYIKNLLGRELYEVLDKAITDVTIDDPMPMPFIKLLEQCYIAIGPLFCYHHADKGDVQFSPSGMQRVETATNKNAYQEQRSKFKEANLTEGEYSLELLVEFLETNREEYPEWLDSDSFKKYKSLFIKTGEEFNQLFPSATPYRNYRQLQSRMLDVEQQNIKKLLGANLFTTLKEKDQKKDPDFTDEEAYLVELLKKAIANLAVAFAAPVMHVQIGPNGITMPAVATFSTNDSDNIRSGASDKVLSSFITACTNAGTNWIAEASQYITNNKPAFESWIGFVVPVTEQTDTSDEPPFNNVFAL